VEVAPSTTSRKPVIIADTFTYDGSSTFTFDSYTGVVAPGMANKAVLVD